MNARKIVIAMMDCSAMELKLADKETVFLEMLLVQQIIIYAPQHAMRIQIHATLLQTLYAMMIMFVQMIYVLVQQEIQMAAVIVIIQTPATTDMDAQMMTLAL